MKLYTTEQERQTSKQMDRLDAVIHEYLRANRKTVNELADRIGCSPASIWRYCRRPEYFRKAPLGTISEILKLVNVSNYNLRYILGLPTGLPEDGRDGQ